MNIFTNGPVGFIGFRHFFGLAHQPVSFQQYDLLSIMQAISKLSKRII